jgi:myosin heavy subunit
MRQESQLFDVHTKFEAILQSAYQRLYKVVQNMLSPVIVNGFIDNTHPLNDKASALQNSPQKQQQQQQQTGSSARLRSNVDNVIHIFSNVYATLVRLCVPQSITEQLIKQALYFVDALLINALLLRRTLCDQAVVRKMKGNLEMLKRWIVAHEMEAAVKQLDPIMAATEVLCLRPSSFESEEDLRKLRNITRSLTSHQLEKLLLSSTHNISPATVQRVMRYLQQDHLSTAQAQIFVDTFFSEKLQLGQDLNYQNVGIPTSLSLPPFVNVK